MSEFGFCRWSHHVSVDEGRGFGSRLTRDIPARARRSRHRGLVLATARVRQADRARRIRARSSLVGRSFALGGPLLKIWLPVGTVLT
jgi:hypothetical protein